MIERLVFPFALSVDTPVDPLASAKLSQYPVFFGFSSI
jgi:hypothetical protein